MMLTKLNDPFNFESVLDRLDIKISESIMVLQDDKASLEAKVRPPVALFVDAAE